MLNPNDPTMKDMQDLYEYIKTWHMLVNKRLNNTIESEHPITLKGPNGDEIIVIDNPEDLKHVRIGLIIASSLIKPFHFYSNSEVEIDETD